MTLLSLSRVSLKLAEQVILDAVDWQIHAKEKIALVGRNGAGKSSLLNLIQGDLTPDSGEIKRVGGLTLAGMTQHVSIADDTRVYTYLVQHLGELGDVLDQYHQALENHDKATIAQCEHRIEALNGWDVLPRIETIITRLSIPTNTLMQHLSGGSHRRVLLAGALLAQPQLLLLDEPTNHLDVQTIEWLESYLKQYQGSVLFVTHDRQFLNQLANRIVEIDRGQLFNYACNYTTYLDRREAQRLTEAKHDALFDKRLQDEETWIRQGVQARRTRNEGRVRRLKAMRETHRSRRNATGDVKSIALDTTYAGKTILEAKKLNYSIDATPIVQDFSLCLNRGDKIGIIGPNGCGKTTLIRLLLGELQPQSGSVKWHSTLDIAYFDQLRKQLDENNTVLQNVADGADFVTINGKKKHVAAYLSDFLFPQARFNQQVFTLSGGERNRLLLAKLLAKPVNLLVMDEPTNDLDIETLELLESLLVDYTGTLLIISHDREFINHVVTHVMVHEDDGQFHEFLGDYNDYLHHKKNNKTVAKTNKPSVSITANSKRPPRQANKLSYNEQRELQQLPQRIERLEKELQTKHGDMSTPEFYQQDTAAIVRITTEINRIAGELKQLYLRWEQLDT